MASEEQTECTSTSSNIKEKYKEELLNATDDMRRDGVLCNVKLRVGDEIFRAHRSTLAACSPYFRGLFTNEMLEKSADEIRLDFLEVSVMNTLLRYMYTGEVDFTEENARALVSAADYLIIQSLKELGSRFLIATLNPSNCFNLSSFAEKYSCQALADSAMQFIVRNFVAACDTQAFKSIEYGVLVDIISRDDLLVNGEEEVYEAVVSWVKHSIDSRAELFEDLFSRVRLFSIPKHYLINHIDKEELVNSSFICTRSLLEALKWQVSYDHSDDKKPRVCLEKYLNVIALCGGNLSREVVCFLPETKQWSPLADMLVPRDEHVTTTWDNHVYAFGSTQQENGQAAEQFDYRINSWTAVANMPGARSASSAVTCADQIYVIGGRITYEGSTNKVMRYDPAINRWYQEPPMTSSRAGLCAVSLGECVYVMGGLNHSNEFLNTVECYNPRHKSWVSLEPMRATRYFACAVVLNKKIFVIGGQSYSGAYLSSCETYDPETDEWSALPNVSVARQAAGVARIGCRIYLFGGCNNSGSLDTVECYDERSRAWAIVTRMPCKRSWIQCQVLRVAEEMLKT